MSLRKLSVSTILVFAAIAVPVASEASPIFIAGDAEACFGLGCTPGDTATYGAGLISYTSLGSTDFSGWTDPDDGGLGVNWGTGNFGSLFVGSSNPSTLVNTPFSLLLTFAAPAVSDAAFSARITGKISTTQSNGILINFDPNEIVLPYTTASGSGLLNITVFDTAVPSTGAGNITGYIQATAVPEPATLLLFSASGFGLFASRRRFRISR
jgi:PEP-CTERM motif-containing protein